MSSGLKLLPRCPPHLSRMHSPTMSLNQSINQSSLLHSSLPCSLPPPLPSTVFARHLSQWWDKELTDLPTRVICSNPNPHSEKHPEMEAPGGGHQVTGIDFIWVGSVFYRKGSRMTPCLCYYTRTLQEGYQSESHFHRHHVYESLCPGLSVFKNMRNKYAIHKLTTLRKLLKTAWMD